MSRNNYLGKEFNTKGKLFEPNKKYNTNLEIINQNGINKTYENNKFNVSNKSKVKLIDKKNNEKGKNMKIIDEQNIQYKNQNSKVEKEENQDNGDNLLNEENTKIYQNKIKELENTIDKMNLDFSKEIEKHKNEIIEKKKKLSSQTDNMI